jgi:hypothetical protein
MPEDLMSSARKWGGPGAKRIWPISDHFDGKRFFNPTLPDGFAPTLRSISRMLREPRSRWPRVVENKGVPQLNATLAVDDIAVTFVGHATFLIQIGGIAILTDPISSSSVTITTTISTSKR